MIEHLQIKGISTEHTVNDGQRVASGHTRQQQRWLQFARRRATGHGPDSRKGLRQFGRSCRQKESSIIDPSLDFAGQVCKVGVSAWSFEVSRIGIWVQALQVRSLCRSAGF